MSYQGSPTRRPLGKLFCFTRWGIVFFLLALIILAAGVLRMELATILWGSAFALLAVYCLIANRIMQSVLRRCIDRTPDPVDFTLPAEGVFPRSSTTAELTALLPRYRAPGINIGFEISLLWPGRDALSLKCDLGGGVNRRTFEFSPTHRGHYQSREARIVVSDLLGFTRIPLPLPLAEGLRVFPSVQPEPVRRPPSLEGEADENRRKPRRRSAELLEVRKYFPGDDIRKVHWKVFAHTSELFLRIGEETPPPESRFLVILDPGITQAVPRRINADYLDTLVERCAATVLEVLGRGYQVFFTLCAAGPPREIKLEKTRQLLAELAGVFWSDRYALELPRRSLSQILLFSTPGSANLPRLFADLEKRSGDVRLLFPDLMIPDEDTVQPGIRRLLFLPAAEQRGKSPVIGREELEAFRSVLDQEIRRYGRRGERKVAVETI